MDLNLEYAAHQKALMKARGCFSEQDRRTSLASASLIADRIGAYQHGLGAAAACAWSKALFAAPT